MAGPRKRYLVGNFTHFLRRIQGPPGTIEPRNPYVVTGRGKSPRNKTRNLAIQAEQGFTHFKKIHAALERKKVGEKFELMVESKSGPRSFIYEKVAEGDYRLIGKNPPLRM